jgi:hypothetical protein
VALLRATTVAQLSPEHPSALGRHDRGRRDYVTETAGASPSWKSAVWFAGIVTRIAGNV